MGKIILIRHGKAGFGESDYDQLSKMGEYQAQVTGRFFKQAKIHPTAIYSGNLKRQQKTADIVKQNAKIADDIIFDKIFNEYDYQGIIDNLLPGLMTDDPSIAKDVDKAFSDFATFERIFSALLERWLSNKYDSKDLESFESYMSRVISGIESIAEKQNSKDIAFVFTSGGLIAVSMHLILGLPPIEALKLGWTIYNCSITSFYVSGKNYRLETFNSVGHLQMNCRDGIVSKI
jgi:broad specificity phosphatase PhoE